MRPEAEVCSLLRQQAVTSWHGGMATRRQHGDGSTLAWMQCSWTDSVRRDARAGPGQGGVAAQDVPLGEQHLARRLPVRALLRQPQARASAASRRCRPWAAESTGYLHILAMTSAIRMGWRSRPPVLSEGCQEPALRTAVNWKHECSTLATECSWPAVTVTQHALRGCHGTGHVILHASAQRPQARR